MNHVLEYIIKAADKTAAGIQSALARVKGFSSTVNASMAQVKKSTDTAPIEEKFVHTSHVLDRMGLAYERLGVKGQDFNDAMDVLERRLDRVNQTGQGQQELFEHLKMSLEDFGASSKNVAEAQKMLKESIVEVKNQAANVSGSMENSFNPLRALTNAMHGNFGGMAREIAKLIPGIKEMGASGTMAIGAFGAAVMSVTKLLGALRDLFKTAFNLDKLPKDLSQASGHLADMVNSTNNFYESMKNAREEATKITAQMKEQVAATADLQKAQNDLNRARELAAAKSDEERQAINTRYDRMNAAVDSGASGQTAEIERQALKEEGDRLNRELQKALDDQDAYLSQMKKFNRKARLESTGVMGSLVSHVATGFYGGKDRTEKAEAWNRAATTASNEYDKAVERAEAIRKQIEENNAKLAVANTKKKTEAIKNEAREQTNIAEDEEKKQEEQAKKAAEYAKMVEKQNRELEKQERERQREEERKAREREREEIRKQREQERENAKAAREEEKRRHEEKVADMKREREILNGINRNVDKARGALSAATSRVSEAWGWYKDTESLKGQIASEEKEIAARKQYEKDFEKLRTGRWSDEFAEAKRLQRKGETDKLDEQMAKWRKGSFGMSVEDEATMRVALAKEAEKDAQRSLEELVSQSEEQNEHLKRIAESLTGEKEDA